MARDEHARFIEVDTVVEHVTAQGPKHLQRPRLETLVRFLVGILQRVGDVEVAEPLAVARRAAHDDGDDRHAV